MLYFALPLTLTSRHLQFLLLLLFSTCFMLAQEHEWSVLPGRGFRCGQISGPLSFYYTGHFIGSITQSPTHSAAVCQHWR